MAFTNTQMRQLKAKLDPKHIKTRQFGGKTLFYLEGWHAIAEANRIFGFDGWDRETVSTDCVSSSKSRGDYCVAYTAKVRITVRAGEITVVREGSGTGEAKAFSPGQAHELALKCAETDATKRALASFGNSFGQATSTSFSAYGSKMSAPCVTCIGCSAGIQVWMGWMVLPSLPTLKRALGASPTQSKSQKRQAHSRSMVRRVLITCRPRSIRAC